MGRSVEPVCKFKIICACGYLETVFAGRAGTDSHFSVVSYVPQAEEGGAEWIRKHFVPRFVKRNGQ